MDNIFEFKKSEQTDIHSLSLVEVESKMQNKPSIFETLEEIKWDFKDLARNPTLLRGG